MEINKHKCTWDNVKFDFWEDYFPISADGDKAYRVMTPIRSAELQIFNLGSLDYKD